MSTRHAVQAALGLCMLVASAPLHAQPTTLPSLPSDAQPPQGPPPPSEPPPPQVPLAPAPVPYAAEAPRAPIVPRGAARFGAELGWRTQRIASAGYDPFSRDDWHGFSSLSGWYVAVTRAPLALAATGGWDVGVSSAAARGQGTSLAMHRLWVAPEARIDLARLGHLLLRAGPSVWHMRAELSDAGLDAPLVRRPWKVGGDVAVGARARALELRDERGAWLLGFVGAELGYAYVPKVDMQLDPKKSAVSPRDVRGVRLPDLDASGVTVRLTISGAF